MPPTKKDEAQQKRFIETARQLECDEDQERFEEKLGKIATATKTSASKPLNNRRQR